MTPEERSEAVRRFLDLLNTLKDGPDVNGPSYDSEEGNRWCLIYRYRGEKFGGVREWEIGIRDELQACGMVIRKIETTGLFVGSEPDPDCKCNVLTICTVDVDATFLAAARDLMPPPEAPPAISST